MTAPKNKKTYSLNNNEKHKDGCAMLMRMSALRSLYVSDKEIPKKIFS